MPPNYHFQLLQTLPSPSFPNLLLSLPCALLPTNITWWEFPEKVKAFVNTLPVVTATHPPRRSAPHTGLHGLRATFCFLYSYSHDSEMKWSICEFLPVSILWPVFSHGRYLSHHPFTPSTKYNVVDTHEAPCFEMKLVLLDLDFPNMQEVSTNV